MMHELWPDHISLACSAVNLVVYKISTENTIFQDTEETYSRCVCMLCETWKGTFLILTLQYEFLFMSYLLSFFLSFFFSVFFFVSITLCTTFHLCFCLSFLFTLFLRSFLLSFFFPFSCSFSRFFSSWPFFHFYSFLPFVTLHLSFLLSFLQFYPHILPCPVPSLYYLFTFLCISASYSSQLLHVILERLRRSLCLNKSTGMYECMSRCLIRWSVSSCPLNSVGLQLECFIIADLVQEPTSVQFCCCQFHSGYI